GGTGTRGTGTRGTGTRGTGPGGTGLWCFRLTGLPGTRWLRIGKDDSVTGTRLLSLGLGGARESRLWPCSGLLRASRRSGGPTGAGVGAGRLVHSLWASAEEGRRVLPTGAGLVLRRNALVPRAAVARALARHRVIVLARWRRGEPRLL